MGLQNSLMKAARKLNVWLYHASGGKVGGSINGSPLLLLTVVGRKSSQIYTIPLAYVLHNGEYLIAASAGGADKDPAWLPNLLAMPQAKIEVNGTTYNVEAKPATGDDRDRLYALFKAQGSNFAEYEKKTARTIPVIRLRTIAAQ